MNFLFQSIPIGCCTWIGEWIFASWTIFTLATLDDCYADNGGFIVGGVKSLDLTTVLKDNEYGMMEW